MKRVSSAFLAVCFAASLALSVGCGDSKVDTKQPKLTGPPDPKIKGPAQPGGGGDSKPGDAALP